jgi:hypothetical protein
MTATVRNQIVDAALALLNTDPPTGFPVADDHQLESYQPGQLPAVTVFEIRDEGEINKIGGRWGPFLDRNLTFRVEVRVAGDVGRAIVDPFLAWIGTCLGGQQFGGLATDTFEALTEWQYAALDQPYTLVQQDFRVQYSVLKTDPTRTQ